MTLLDRSRGRCRHWGLALSSTPATLRRANRPPRLGGPTGFTLVEMLVAMAITLVMVAAVVTLFANVTGSVSKRRATMELSGQIRGVRNVLQQDLQGATCPGVTWQRPESNHGYIELIEGQCREGNASDLLDGDPNNSASGTWPPTKLNPEIDHTTSILPSSNVTPFKDPAWVTDGAGLGDYDDVLMLTVRNEQKPFVGRAPSIPTDPRVDNSYSKWDSQPVESPLAEVVWFAIENPGYEDNFVTDPTAKHFFGEPGMRTIYRRTLLIAPWLNPYKALDGDNNGLVQDANRNEFKPVPGLLRLLPAPSFPKDNVAAAIAALISFQDRYDISCRVEWDHSIGQWKIIANTLGDLTKRENRFGHFQYMPGPPQGTRIYPFALESRGSGYSNGTEDVTFVSDPDIGPPGTNARFKANIASTSVVSYSNDAPGLYTDRYQARPFAYVDKRPSEVPATAQAMLNDDGAVVRVVHGPVPLWGTRRGEDVMLTDVLAFDLRVFDPGAPLFATRKPTGEVDVVLTPSDPGWRTAFLSGDNMTSGRSQIGKNNSQPSVVYPYVGQGAYVDLGYGYFYNYATSLPAPEFVSNFSSSAVPWFFAPPMELAVALARNSTVLHGGALIDVYGRQLAPGFAVYDTWSFHYENDGVDEDLDTKVVIDQGTDGLDGLGHYLNPTPPAIPPFTVDDTRLGVDDVGERETTPPYDKPLRGVQLLIRAYERDSRSIKQVRVNQHFMPE